jgi:hypothetical protein
VPRVVGEMAKPGMTILDFGAGKEAIHVHMLRAKGLDVTAYDFGANVRLGLHDPDALSRQYDLVYASNVLNVQSSLEMLHGTVAQIAGATKDEGHVVVNLPREPRKCADVTVTLLRHILEEHGLSSLQLVGGNGGAPVFLAIKHTKHM